MKNSFNVNDTAEFISRIDKLTPTTKPIWGKMDVAKMMAHCNVTYELEYENIHPKPNGFVKLMLVLFVKNSIVGQKPYKKNGQTGSQFRTLYNKTQYRIFGFWDKTASEHTNMLTFNTFGFSSIYKTISFLSTPHF